MRALAISCLMVTITSLCGAQAAPVAALFGTAEFKAESLAALPQWRRVLAEIDNEEATYNACAEDPKSCSSRALMAWEALLQGLKGAPDEEQVRKVNRFVNQWRYRTDQANYGRSDHWSSPLNFMRYSGDCEDYAITKYVSLRRLGFEADQLRLVVVQDTLRDIAHAVLAVYLPEKVVILDNLTNAVLPHGRVSQYRPYYSVNETTRWAHVPPGQIMLSAQSIGGDAPFAGDGP